MTPTEILESAVNRFCCGEDKVSQDVILASVAATVSIDEKLRDGEGCEVASFHLNHPLIMWKLRLEAEGEAVRLVLCEMTAADMSHLRVHGVVHMQQRPQHGQPATRPAAGVAKDGASTDSNSDEDGIAGTDSEVSTTSACAVQGSSGSSPTYCCSPSPSPSPPRRSRPLLQPACAPVVVLTDRPATIATFHRDVVAQVKVTMSTFYYHPGGQRPDGGDDYEDLRLHRLSSDFSRLLASQSAADVTLVVEDQLLQVHRAVLVARSEVLRRMLEEAEAVGPGAAATKIMGTSLRLELPNATLDAVVKVLDFVYSADVRALAGSETVVLVLAARLGLADLADECCRRLLRALDGDSGVAGVALELLAFAEQHGVRALKERALLVVVQHLREVTASPEWLQLKRRMPSLAADLLETAARELGKP